MAISQESEYGAGFEHFSGSEYGSTFDDEEEILIEDLLTQLSATTPGGETLVIQSAQEDDGSALPTVLIHSSPIPAVVRLGEGVAISEHDSPSPTRCAAYSPSAELEYDSCSRDGWRAPRDDGEKSQPGAYRDDEPISRSDTRTPLQRFRTKPNKPLSVTDLVSPAWCELQFWYNLTRFGRKPQTEAMRQGSKIHKALEEEVHTTVPVQTKTKEDRFGLRIWNAIQGLRTLKVTGMTRELEVWGVVSGQVINGVIDELSYTCPDSTFGESLERSKTEKAGATLPLGQLTLVQSLALAEKERYSNDDTRITSKRIVYLSDTKTRSSKSVPIGARLRPTWMQLMLYRRLLRSLSLNTVDAETVFSRYNVRPRQPFTEVFMGGIANLDGQSERSQQSPQSSKEDENPFSVLQASEIHVHNNLMALWSLMVTEYQWTVGSVSDVLRADFRYARTGEIFGSEVTAFDNETIDDYIADELSWWKGEREAKGVDIEEAYKCRTCDFAEECTWRKRKIDEAIEKSRLRTTARAKAAI